MGGLSIIIGHRSSLVQITKIASQRLPLTTHTIQRFASELMWLLALLLRATVAQFPTTLRLEKVKSISIPQASRLWIKNVVIFFSNKAMVETGDSEICQVHSLDATKRFSKAR